MAVIAPVACPKPRMIQLVPVEYKVMLSPTRAVPDTKLMLVLPVTATLVLFTMRYPLMFAAALAITTLPPAVALSRTKL